MQKEGWIRQAEERKENEKDKKRDGEGGGYVRSEADSKGT